MIHLIPSQYKTPKALIIAMAALLALGVCIALLVSSYQNMQVALEEQEQQLFIDQKNIRKLKSLRRQVGQQKQQVAQFERALLKGQSQDAVISTMQIQVQSMLTSSGLDPESLRPITARETGGSAVQSVALKLRLSGSIEQLTNFLSTIYKADAFFQIEGLTIKPFKKDQLKIYMDLRGYHQPQAPSQAKGGKS